MIAKCRTQCECVDELVFSFDFSTSEGISGVLFAKERERERELASTLVNGALNGMG